jgi:NADPH:quinone reductase-like Zn-dependent oxidoreductase
VRPLEPAAGQIRMRVRAAGVGPTDLAIRRGNLKEVFALAQDAVLGFEAAVGVLGQLGIVQGETLLILGGAGSVGIIATQLAVSYKATVIAAANPRTTDCCASSARRPSLRESDSSSRSARSLRAWMR